jgi:hypothetical protein
MRGGKNQLGAIPIVTGLEGKWKDESGRVYIFGPGMKLEWHVPLPDGKGTAIYTGIYTDVQNRVVVMPEHVTCTNPKQLKALQESMKNHRAGTYFVAKQPDDTLYMRGPGGSLVLKRI